MSDEQFEFERLEVHKLALRLMPIVRRIAGQLPRGFGDLGNHLVRSARSIHLNIAEGAGKYRAGAKAERYVTARASANECASAIEEARLFRLASERELNEARDLLKRITPMLTRLIVRWDPKRGH